nr:MarR family transcriptional regulator [uncultured Acetatifactor sp.]
MVSEEKREIALQIKSVNNLIRRNLDIRFAEAGLGELAGMQGPILGFLQKEGQQREIFQKDLEKRFNIRRSTATVMLQNLEQKGYIVREAVHSDARMKRIVLTQKAIRHNLAIRDQIDAFNKELEEGLTSEEKKMFLRILDKIKKNLE